MKTTDRDSLSRIKAHVVAALLAGGLLSSIAIAQNKIDLDVTRVALFSSGVGFFQADARVDGDASAELKFRTDQINDILKSLVVQDLDGGTIGVVSYASRDPIDKTLRSFGVDITGKPTLPQLLDQLRGEPIEIGSPRALSGVILGVEKRRVSPGGKDAIVEIDVLNLLTEGGIEQVEIATVQGLRFASEKVAGELKKALATLTLAHDADKKSVVLNFNGKGQRRIMAAYLLETPIWKTSYRLVFSNDKKPFLQGWATVENATEEDWNNVRLSLVSGRPISFRMDLYTPLYVPRPLEQLELYASLRPPEYDAGEKEFLGRVDAAMLPPAAAPMADAARRKLAKSAAPGSGRAGIAGQAAEGVDETVARDLAMGAPLGMAGVDSVASAEKAGELFEYSIKSPVSIPRQHSAMLPIVNDTVEGEKLSIFNPATHPKHPLNGLELVNKTGLHLMQGPITLFDGNTYAGDAKLPDLGPNEKRLIAYALDLAAEVTQEQMPMVDQIVSLRIAKGVLVHKHKYVERREYRLKNKSDADKIILIEQPYDTSWKLVEPKEPYDKTESLLRFKVPVAAQKTATLPVELEKVGDSSVMLSAVSLDDVRWWLRVPVISPKLKEALEKVVRLRTELDDAARQRAAMETQVNEATSEQGRVRENLRTLPNNTDQYQRQLKRFDQLEDQITKLRDQLAELRKTEESKRKALDEYLMNLDLD